MPGLFTPVVRNGAVLVDGGLVNPVPVSMCRALGAELVIAVDLSWGKLGPYRRGNEQEIAPREVPGWLDRIRPEWMKKTPDAHEEPNVPSIFDVFMTSLDIVEMRVARSRLAGEPADVLVTPILPDFATMDFHRAKEAIEEGRAAVDRMGPSSSRYWVRRAAACRRGVARARRRAMSARRRSLRSAACRRRGAR